MTALKTKRVRCTGSHGALQRRVIGETTRVGKHRVAQRQKTLFRVQHALRTRPVAGTIRYLYPQVAVDRQPRRQRIRHGTVGLRTVPQHRGQPPRCRMCRSCVPLLHRGYYGGGRGGIYCAPLASKPYISCPCRRPCVLQHARVPPPQLRIPIPCGLPPIPWCEPVR